MKKVSTRRFNVARRVEEYNQRALREMVVGYFSPDGAFAEDVEALCPKDRIAAFVALAPYVFPRLEASSIELGVGAAVLDAQKGHLLSLTQRLSSAPAAVPVVPAATVVAE